MNRLAGTLAVVTGGSRGIGRATALGLASQGARVAFCARESAPVLALAEKLGPGHLGCHGIDVASSRDVEQFADRVLGELGVPDVLVCNAGAAFRALLEETDEASWDRVLDVNLKGSYLVARAFVPAMRTRQRGRIICISSISGRQGTARSSAYCAAKHGVVGFVRALAEELRSDSIAVNAVCPGSVETAMLPPEFAPGMPAEEVARTIVWLAAEAPLSLTGACIDQFG